MGAMQYLIVCTMWIIQRAYNNIESLELLKVKKKNYIEGSGANMGGDVLFYRSSWSELITRCDLPQSCCRVSTNPSVDSNIFAFTRVLILVINLQLVHKILAHVNTIPC